MLSFLIQASIILITASPIEIGIISSTLDSQSKGATKWNHEVPIVLLSLQLEGQIVASRALGFIEIATVVITSLLCNLVSDPKLFLLRNEKRDRRVVAFVLTLVGAIVGGWVTKVRRNRAHSLFVRTNQAIGGYRVGFLETRLIEYLIRGVVTWLGCERRVEMQVRVLCCLERDQVRTQSLAILSCTFYG